MLLLTAGRSLWSGVTLWFQQHAISIYAFILTLLLGVGAVMPHMFITVPAGHVGVMWLRFIGGTVTDKVLPEGMHFILPWDRIFIYDARMQNGSHTYEALGASGLRVELEVAVRYRVNPQLAGVLHKLAGPEYAEVLVYPEIANTILTHVSEKDTAELYSGNRAALQKLILDQAAARFSIKEAALADIIPKGARAYINELKNTGLISVENVLISRVTLPPAVRQAVERKIEQQQILQEYDFRVDREKREAERKAIEAQGIRQFQKTISENITDNYLRLRGIEATRAFADSPNAKTIIIGGRDGLPVILNTGDEAKPSQNDKARQQQPQAQGAGDEQDGAARPPSANHSPFPPHGAADPSPPPPSQP